MFGVIPQLYIYRCVASDRQSIRIALIAELPAGLIIDCEMIKKVSDNDGRE